MKRTILAVLTCAALSGISILYYAKLEYNIHPNTNRKRTKASKALFVALSVNENPYFSYFIPFVAEGWLRCGITPVFILIGSEQSWRANQLGNLSLNYLGNIRSDIILHFLDSFTLIKRWGTRFLSIVARLSVPAVLKRMGINRAAVVLMGDIDVIPLKCHYFQQIPTVMHRYKVDVYMDMVTNRTLPRFAMCYIAASLYVWYRLLPVASTVEETLSKILNEGKYPKAYTTSRIRHPIMNFDELFLGKRIKKLKCFPNCTTFNLNVRDYGELIRGPKEPQYNWTNTFQQNSFETLNFLAKTIEAHVGSGPFSLYGESSWSILCSLISIYMETDILSRLTQYAYNYFRLSLVDSK